MRPVLARAVTLAAVVLLTACGGSDKSDGATADGGAEIQACGALSDDDVEQLTGIAVTHEEKDLPAGRSTCTFTGDDFPVVMVLVQPGDDSVEDIVAASRVGNEDETTTEDVEVPGTEAAVLLTDTAYGVTTTSLVATTSEAGYTVYGSGPTAAEEGRVAVAALTLLLGGTPEAPPALVDEQPCDLLTATEVEKILGSPVTTEPGSPEGSGARRCSYEGGGATVSVYELGRTTPLESVVASYEKSGSTVEEVEVDGLLAAYLVEKPTPGGSVDAYLAGGAGSFVLSVRGAEGTGSADLARDLLPLLAS